MDLKLTGRAVMITGAARGIGAAIAEAYIAEGVRVAICDLDREVAEQTAKSLDPSGQRAIALRCDVCNEAEVGLAIEAATAAFGGIDILVNNAGVAKDCYLTRMPEEDWDTVVNVTLKGAFHSSRAVLPGMMERRWGRIVNISSRSIFGNPGQTAYSAAKAGLIGFTRSLSLEGAKFGITVNAVAPGFVMTPGMMELPRFAELKEAAEKRVPVGFLADPDDIASSVLFLSSPLARYITGTTVFVTGGRYSS